MEFVACGSLVVEEEAKFLDSATVKGTVHGGEDLGFVVVVFAAAAAAADDDDDNGDADTIVNDDKERIANSVHSTAGRLIYS